jgi:hypothetical protein
MNTKTVAAVLIGFALVGCGSDAVEVDGSGVSSETQTRTITCGGVVTLDQDVSGTGGVGITIVDGANNTVFQSSTDVAGQVNNSQDVSGRAGTWTVSVDPANFAGQFKITVDCP